jgi:DNA-damage-inducible protein J
MAGLSRNGLPGFGVLLFFSFWHRGASGNCHSNALHSGSMKEVIMASNALVQTRIDADVKEKATAVLENMGLTVSDAVRILLTRTANEGMLPLELVSNSQAYDSWFREKMRQALADTRPDLDDSEVEAHFAQRRSAALRKAAERKR